MKTFTMTMVFTAETLEAIKEVERGMRDLKESIGESIENITLISVSLTSE